MGPSKTTDDGIAIRRAAESDADAIADVWLSSWRATFDFEPAHPDDEVRAWLGMELLPRSEVWVATDPGGTVVAMMALSPSTVEQLYVAPDWIGRGVGRRLIDLAKEHRPDGLELWCFQVNGRARAFYEANGFRVRHMTDGAANEEHQPDVRYGWRP